VSDGVEGQERIYLDGNSLGPPTPRVAEALAAWVRDWGEHLIGGWNELGWWDLPVTVGDRIARLVGAAPGQVVAADSVTVNLYRLLEAAVALRRDRRRVVTAADDFPTDRYLVASVAARAGMEVDAVPIGSLADAVGDDTAVVVASHVHYRTGELADMARVNVTAHHRGALVLWDLSHSVGAVDAALDATDTDLAVGCSYKYLNGGPGAPAWTYVAHRLLESMPNPIPGWVGHLEPFAMADRYVPAAGIRRMLSGTPPVAGLAALDAALEAFDGWTPGMLREHSLTLTGRFLDHVDTTLAGVGFELVTPRARERRGSQVSLQHPQAYAVVQACIDAGVVGDYREPGICRFGFAPRLLTVADVDAAAERIAAVMRAGSWRDPRFAERRTVT
jgi:kynureninase